MLSSYYNTGGNDSYGKMFKYVIITVLVILIILYLIRYMYPKKSKFGNDAYANEDNSLPYDTTTFFGKTYDYT